MNHARLIAAFFIAPLVPTLLFALACLVFMVPFETVMMIFLAASLVSYGHAILLGVPVAWYFLSFRKRPLTLKRVMFISFLIGALPALLFFIVYEMTLPPVGSYMSNGSWLRVDGDLTMAGMLSIMKEAIFFGISGAFAGCAGWFISGLSSSQKDGER